jgi:hypothetical protein
MKILTYGLPEWMKVHFQGTGNPRKEIPLVLSHGRGPEQQLGVTFMHMAPSKTPKSTSRPKKEKVFHPDSRKAGQLSRVQLRKAKLADAASKRTKKHSAQGA